MSEPGVNNRPMVWGPMDGRVWVAPVSGSYPLRIAFGHVPRFTGPAFGQFVHVYEIHEPSADWLWLGIMGWDAEARFFDLSQAMATDERPKPYGA